MFSSTQSQTLWQTVLWGRGTISPIPKVPSGWFAVGAVSCLLAGLPWLMLLPLAAWNSLVSLRNRWRCPGHAASS